ncbi:MAG: sugar nucleotide-binding protein [Verrucomicrobia bacterium]|nr:sugar nucleotide-binding protein [Verrucomicrobiota bacterium]
MKGPILIVGTEGLLGSTLLALGRRHGLNVFGTMIEPDKANPQILQLNLSKELGEWSPPAGCRAAILCAAITSLEACRRDPAGTRQINVTQTLRLTEKLLAAGVFVVFISSNLVFDGTQPLRRAEEAVCPMTEYGRQKAEVERAFTAFGGKVAIVRLTKVANPRWPLILGWIQAARSGQPVEAFGDFVCAPIPLDVTAYGLLKIAEGRLPGIWQFSADSDVSYAGIARHIVRRMNGDESLVKVVACQGGAFEHSPTHTTLDASRARRELGLIFPEPLRVIEDTYLS